MSWTDLILTCIILLELYLLSLYIDKKRQDIKLLKETLRETTKYGQALKKENAQLKEALRTAFQILEKKSCPPSPSMR